jgi:hypothetical protein
VTLTISAPDRGFIYSAATPARLRNSDIVFGIVLPIICFAADLALGRVTTVAPIAVWSFAGLGMIALLVSARPISPVGMYELLHGVLIAAAAGATIIGVVILPLSFVALLFVVGLLGFVPFATAYVFGRRAYVLFRRTERPRWLVVALGGAMMFAVPIGLQYAEQLWLTSKFDAIESGDPNRTVAALHALNAYPLTLGRADQLVCRSPSTTRNAAVTQAATRLLGRDPSQACVVAFD